MKRYTPLFPMQEKDFRSKIKKLFQFPDEIVNKLHRLSDKHSLTLANYLFTHAKSLASDRHLYIFNSVLKKQELSQDDKDDYFDQLEWAYGSSNDFNIIADWLKGRGDKINPDEPNIKDIKGISFVIALQLAREWKDYIEADKPVETGKVILEYSDGFYWVDLETDYCEIEAKQGAHCGASDYKDGQGNVFSLRTPQHKVALTLDLHLTDRNIRQIRGGANTKPKTKYHRYIVDFLTNKKTDVRHLRLETDHRPEDNFSLNDLSNKDLNKVLKVKPSFEKDSDTLIINLLDVRYRGGVKQFLREHRVLLASAEEKTFTTNTNYKYTCFTENEVRKSLEGEWSRRYRPDFTEISSLFDTDAWEGIIKVKSLQDYLLHRGHSVLSDEDEEDILKNPFKYAVKERLNTYKELGHLVDKEWWMQFMLEKFRTYNGIIISQVDYVGDDFEGFTY